ncbi:TPA: membrane protein insertion efficiency factor YidD [Escherichia coli]|nr:membrane protein insertion efficiency factor YidD [Escherichia coli]HAX5140184.1 membrane protein insertion efficiency factor YidD [Escherichia coli]
MKFISIQAIFLYRRFAPQSVRGRCRYEPSCSTYAILCIRRFGAFRGWLLAIRRIRRCRPPNGGRDLPPVKRS